MLADTPASIFYETSCSLMRSIDRHLPRKLLVVRHTESVLRVRHEEQLGRDELRSGVEDQSKAREVRDVERAAGRDGLVEEEVAENGGDGFAVGGLARLQLA